MSRISWVSRWFSLGLTLVIIICFVEVQSFPNLSKIQNKNIQAQKVFQALRTIRGFRPESLSTARGFGKRFDRMNTMYPNSKPYFYKAIKNEFLNELKNDLYKNLAVNSLNKEDNFSSNYFTSDESSKRLADEDNLIYY